jgi:uncharacterized membrane protein YhaH (DUF805 family)
MRAAIRTCFEKYATLSGRASRSEFWHFQVFLLLVAWLPVPIAEVFWWLDLGKLHKTLSYWGAAAVDLTAVLIVLAAIVPAISVAVRRLHDIDRSGSWVWIGLVPIVGSIPLLVWLCTGGTMGPNRFGEPSTGLGTSDAVLNGQLKLSI